MASVSYPHIRHACIYLARFLEKGKRCGRNRNKHRNDDDVWSGFALSPSSSNVTARACVRAQPSDIVRRMCDIAMARIDWAGGMGQCVDRKKKLILTTTTSATNSCVLLLCGCAVRLCGAAVRWLGTRIYPSYTRMHASMNSGLDCGSVEFGSGFVMRLAVFIHTHTTTCEVELRAMIELLSTYSGTRVGEGPFPSHASWAMGPDLWLTLSTSLWGLPWVWV